MLPKVFQRLLLRCSQTTGLAAGKSVIDDLVDDRIVHRCRFGKEGGHHGELYGNGVRPSKSRPDGDHCIGNPGNQEASTNQHCHLTQGKWETVGSENSWTIQSVWQAWRRNKSFISPKKSRFNHRDCVPLTSENLTQSLSHLSHPAHSPL